MSDGSRNVSAAVAWLLLVLAGAVTAVWIVLAWPWRKVVGEVSLPGPCGMAGTGERAGAGGAGFAGQLGVRIGLVGRTSRLAGWPDRWFWAAGAILLAVLTLSRWMPLDLVILAGLGILFLVRPESSLPLIAFSIPFWPRPHTLVRWEFSLYEILIWLAVAAAVTRWAVAALANRWQTTRDFAPQTSRDLTGETKAAMRRFLGRIACSVRGLDWPVLALLAAGLVATIAAERQDVAIREYRTVFVVGVLFYWLITRVPMRSGDRFSPWPLLDGLTLGGVVVSGLALWQLITGQGRVDVEGVWRVRALYGSPNNLALFLDRTLPLAVAVAAFGCGSKERRALYAAAVALMAAASVATFSKGALLLGLPVGLALVLVGGAWRARRRWPLGLLAALLVGAGLALVRYLRTPRFASLLDLRSGTSALRLKLWAGTWRMALDHPWLGVGPDNFLYAYRSRYVLPSAWQELNLSHPHNVVLDLWTRLGIGGLVAGGWAVIAGMGAGWRLFRFSSAEMWPAFLGLLGGLGATLAHGLIDNSLFLVDLMALFMLALGVFQRSGAGVLRMDEG